MNNIDFYMVTISPWSYFSIDRLVLIANKNNLKINVKPIDIISIFEENQTKMVKDRPIPVQKNRINELKRWSNFLNVELNLYPKFWPVNPEISSKLIIASILYENNYKKTIDLVSDLFKAVWVNELDVSDQNTIIDIANKNSLKEEVINKFIKDEKVTTALNKNTSDAKEKNVFGVPSFIYNGELFWGQDRLFFLENLIQSK